MKNTLLFKLKDFFIPKGTESRINKIKEVRQQLIIVVVLVGLFFSIVTPLMIMKKGGLILTDIEPEYDVNIAVVHLDKQITVPYVNHFMQRLEEIKEKVEDGTFKYLIIVGSSPGGSPQGSDELANYLIEYQKIVPTSFYVQNICASGCYYIASAIKKIEGEEYSGISANVNSIVGSIGVVMPHFVYGPALEKYGFKNEYIVMGNRKVPMDSWSLVDDDSKAYIKKNLLAPVYSTFRSFVQNNRELSDKEMSQLDEGRVFVASLVEGTLVDKITYYQEIREAIKKKIEKENPDKTVGIVMVGVEPHKKSLFGLDFKVDNINVGGFGSSLDMQTNKLSME